MGLRENFVCTGPSPHFGEEEAQAVVDVNQATSEILGILDRVPPPEAVFIAAVVSKVVQNSFKEVLNPEAMAGILALTERAVQYFPEVPEAKA